MSDGQAFLFATAGGAAVGNLYWAQPILSALARDLGVCLGTAALLVTFTQVGYAVGVFLLVPLGDIADRRRLIPRMMTAAALMLGASALAPSFPILLVTLGLVGASTVSGQMLAPLAGDLATDQQRGHVLGTVAAGIGIGILAARAISGVITDLLGWRALYGTVAIAMVLMALVMRRSLPTLPPRTRAAYPDLLASVPRTFLMSATARWTGFLGACAMCVFTLYWTGLTFLLSGQPFGFSATQIGLISLIGILGAVAGQRAGGLYDRGLAMPAIGVGLAGSIAAFALSGLAPHSLTAVTVSIALFSVGIQVVQVMTQTRMLSIDPGARSRLNTLFVVGNFLGSSIGSALASALWGWGGWPLAMAGATAILLVALLAWLVQRRRALDVYYEG
ncbi:MFS transporter [Actinomyces sp. 594]|uniref:MFS transporter n=1 Tax=Actinomyces sp. 594 TaxID=2057793 RepID=UPI001C59357E|nr:MFS transporter [Actinomyces sp. 594]MBW3069376.1 MFS transporter [Actinomyces sp. 594]